MEKKVELPKALSIASSSLSLSLVGSFRSLELIYFPLHVRETTAMAAARREPLPTAANESPRASAQSFNLPCSSTALRLRS